MTTAMEDPLTVSGERAASAGSNPQPLDLGLLVTLDSRMHCRMPMKRIDPLELPVRQPIYVDGTGVLPALPAAPSASVVTYRCACGFTIDDPAAAQAIGTEPAVAAAGYAAPEAYGAAPAVGTAALAS